MAESFGPAPELSTVITVTIKQSNGGYVVRDDVGNVQAFGLTIREALNKYLSLIYPKEQGNRQIEVIDHPDQGLIVLLSVERSGTKETRTKIGQIEAGYEFEVLEALMKRWPNLLERLKK